MDPDRLPGGRVDPLVAVAHDSLVDLVGDQQHQLGRRAARQDRAAGVGVQQPGRVVEAGPGVAVRVGQQLAGMDRDPEPHALRRGHLPVVVGKPAGQGRGQRVQQPRGGDLCGDQ
jgi:hypothetical protein